MMLEKHQKTLLLVLHVALLQVGVVWMEICPTVPNKNLTCYNDFMRNITCTYASDRKDNVCTLHAEMMGSPDVSHSCQLEPTDGSRPGPKKCSLIFVRTFKSFTFFSLDLSCDRGQTQISDMLYRPLCHIKLMPPEKPNINGTTASWKAVRQRKFGLEFQLQWKQEITSWSDPSVQKEMKQTQCDDYCASELNPILLIQGEGYTARLRVRCIIMFESESVQSTWSDWSPTASWVSLVGEAKQKSGAVVVWWYFAAAGVPFALILFFIFRADKANWVYVTELIKGPPLPPFLQHENLQKWQSSVFTSESYLSFLKPLAIDSVEVTSTVDNIAPRKQERLPLEKSIRDCSQELSSSSFSNPSYSQLCPVPPVCSLTAGNLEPCAADSPYGPAGGQSQNTNPQPDVEKPRGKDVDIAQLLSKANKRQPLPVISDYEKIEMVQVGKLQVEKLQVERDRLQSVDSGVCSAEEVSQESLELHSISQRLNEEPGSKKQCEEGNRDCIQKLFGHSNSGDGFSKGSIELCSDYEQVQKLLVEIPDDGSVDSDLGIRRDQQLSHHHLLSTPSTLSPSDPPSTALLLSSFTPSPLNFTRLVSSLGPRPLAALIDQTAMSNNSSLEPSADGYLPVTQEES